MNRIPLVLHSVSYSGSWGQQFLPVEQFLDKAADLGFDGVMLTGQTSTPVDFGLESGRASSTAFACGEILTYMLPALPGYTNFTADLEHRRYSEPRISDPTRGGAGGDGARSGMQPGESVHRI